MDDLQPRCVSCGEAMPGSRHLRKYCSGKCRSRWRKAHPQPPASHGHKCRICGTHITLGRGQYNKWICSAECQRASNAKSVREFYIRRPQIEATYRARTKEKMPPDSQSRRFYALNPCAPRACQACGEDRVVEVAHRPGHERFGQRRSAENMQWPAKVWVLCPTCHRLLDRMRYTPAELGLE